MKQQKIINQRHQQRKPAIDGVASGGGHVVFTRQQHIRSNKQLELEEQISKIREELDLAMNHLYESISTYPFIDVTDHGGTELFWICLPISPYSTAVRHAWILEIFIRILILLLSLIDLSGYIRGSHQLKETTESTLLILQIVINKFTYFKQINNQSVFDKINQALKQSSLQKLDQLLRLRDKCNGYLFIACTRTEYVMSMTAWERQMIDPHGNIIDVQEHALIQRNIVISSSSSSLKGISLFMHSYAGYKLQKPKIVCSPYEQMQSIIKGAIKKGQIHQTGERLSPIDDDPCIAFGAHVQIENDTSLQQIWLSKRKQIQIRQQSKESHSTPPSIQTPQKTRSQSLMEYIQKSKQSMIVTFQSDKRIDLSKFPNLIHLHLDCNDLQNEDDLYPLSHMKKLRSLRIRTLGDKGMKVLFQILPSLSDLRILDLGYNSIGKEKMQDLVKIFPDMSKKLNTLCLNSNSLGNDGGIKILADNLYHLSKLRILMLQSNKINDEDIEYLISMLSFHQSPKLITLDIRNNSIIPMISQQLSTKIKYVLI